MHLTNISAIGAAALIAMNAAALTGAARPAAQSV
jgi:hypothetical protein